MSIPLMYNTLATSVPDLDHIQVLLRIKKCNFDYLLQQEVNGQVVWDQHKYRQS